MKADFRASELRQSKQTDEVKVLIQASEARQSRQAEDLKTDQRVLKADLQASEVRQSKRIDELNDDLKEVSRVA